MKKYLEEAMVQAAKANYEIKETRMGSLITIENAAIVYAKFNNKPDVNGSTERTFKVILSEDMAKEVHDRGWKLYPVPTYDDEIPTLDSLKVKVSDNYFPPIDLIFRDKTGAVEKRVSLTLDTVETLDSVDLNVKDENGEIMFGCDIIIKPTISKAIQARKPKDNPYVYWLNRGYFNALNPEFFGGKYDEDKLANNPDLQEELNDTLDDVFGGKDFE